MLPFFFFFNDTATTEIYTLSLHDALPIFLVAVLVTGLIALLLASWLSTRISRPLTALASHEARDRKSTRLNSSHVRISYAVFCLKKKIPRPKRWYTTLARGRRPLARQEHF